MANCHEMKEGEIYICKDCGLELMVVKECQECGEPEDTCGCHSEHEACSFSCCGKEMVKK